MSRALAESLNLHCGCVTTDRGTLGMVLAGSADEAFARSLAASHPHLFASQAIFVDPTDVATMQATVDAVERVVELPAYVDHVLRDASPSERHPTKTRGVFFGYDFHLTDAGPRLIEINTNAGGALLQAALAKAQQPCCPPVRERFAAPFDPAAFENAVLAMFRSEFTLARGDAPLTHVAIVDQDPEAQFLRPEFELFARLFERGGVRASVLDPQSLVRRQGSLRSPDGSPIDLVYLRSTDFDLGEGSHASLRDAYLADEVVVTPAPRTHRVYADKRNLCVFSDADVLRALGATAEDVALLTTVVPATRLVDAADRDTLWSGRSHLFFKPADGFGSRAAYRGDKLTKRVFEEILGSGRPYVAQALVTPSERAVSGSDGTLLLKVDVRAFAYGGRVQLLAGRLYQGQTTNLRTKEGGLAAVVTETMPPHE